MGINFKDIVVRHEISFEDLADKKIAVDAYNILYQFLSAIRQKDGTPLMDTHGNITSHLAGLFTRTMKMLETGIKPVYVFDGEAPVLKSETLEQRKLIKQEAEKKYKRAISEEKLEEAMKYAQQTSYLTKDMVKQAKKLLDGMGIPHLTAIGDAEAQASYMAQKGFVWAAASQDYDSLLYGAPRLIRNLTVSGKKKVPRKKEYVEVKPELIELPETLNSLGIDRSRLVRMALLIGTDYNEGIKGVGPKNALKLVKANKDQELKDQIKHYKQVYDLFTNPPVIRNISLEWKPIDVRKVKNFLVEDHDFSEKRINSLLGKFKKSEKKKSQSSLEGWT